MPPTSKLILGAISEFDKAMTVAKLRGVRERKRREVGKCEGRKSHAERNPALVARAKRLHRKGPKGGRMSLRAISAELAAANVGSDKDSDKRQRAAIASFAKAHGYRLIDEFWTLPWPPYQPAVWDRPAPGEPEPDKLTDSAAGELAQRVNLTGRIVSIQTIRDRFSDPFEKAALAYQECRSLPKQARSRKSL